MLGTELHESDISQLLWRSSAAPLVDATLDGQAQTHALAMAITPSILRVCDALNASYEQIISSSVLITVSTNSKYVQYPVFISHIRDLVT